MGLGFITPGGGLMTNSFSTILKFFLQVFASCLALPTVNMEFCIDFVSN